MHTYSNILLDQPAAAKTRVVLPADDHGVVPAQIE